MIAATERLFTAPVQRDPLGTQRRRAEPNAANVPELSQIMAMLRDVIAEQRDTRLELASLRREVQAEHGRPLDEPGGKVALPSVPETGHASALHRGLLIGALDARVRRIERHLGLPPLD